MPSEVRPQESGYSVTVDYARRIDQMMDAGGYDWVSSDVAAEHFPVTGTHIAAAAIELIHFNRGISTDRALAAMEEQSLAPADFPTLLVFGATYPDIQRKFPVIALGSVRRIPNGDRGYPYLCGDDAERGLGLRWCQDDWGQDCRFAAVRR